MLAQITVGDISVDVIRKEIKNVHLSIHPPTGRVRVSAPTRMNLETIRVFAIQKLAWIRQQQQKIQGQARETPREYIERESHYVWGRRYLLSIKETDEPASIDIKHRTLILYIRQQADYAKRQTALEDWFREQVKLEAPALISKWEPILGVNIKKIYVRRMRTKWGSCNPQAHSIRLNTDLAKKPRECLEYIIVHEMVHMLEPTHNARFIALMDQFMPKWKFYRQQLNRLPVRHEEWTF